MVPSTAHLRAVLTEYGLPVDGRATVRAEVSGPVAATVGLAWVGSGGRYEEDLPLPLPGTYHVRVVAEGLTMRSAPFTREQSLTAVALPGGDNPPPNPSGDDGRLCDPLTCLTKVSAKALEPTASTRRRSFVACSGTVRTRRWGSRADGDSGTARTGGYLPATGGDCWCGTDSPPASRVTNLPSCHS